MRRIYKMRLGSGLVLSLPVLVGTAWYAWCAFADLDRYRRASKDALPVTVERFHLALHDQLDRDLRRMVLPERPSTGRMETFELSLTREALDALGSSGGKEGSDSYVRGLVKKDELVHKARIRQRGGQHWHSLMPQRSLKIRLEAGGLLDGVRVFNLINDPTPFGLEDQVILDLAREGGLLSPEYRPVWVRLNNSDLGVFRYESQPDEGLLRRNRRVPGSIFSGDAGERQVTGVPTGVFGTASAWRKAASSSEDQRDDLEQLEELLAQVNTGTHQEFADYARQRLDLERYAFFDALDVVFGGNEHDYASNHRLHFDAYRGRFEPVAWSFRGFQHQPWLNQVDHPLLIRLKFTPGYLELRNRRVYALLTGPASVPAIRERVQREMAKLAPELAADPYWDAYKLLPRSSRFERFMVRPMSMEKWVAASVGELGGFEQRSRFLLGILQRPGIRGTFAPHPAGALLSFTVDGESSYALEEVMVKGRCPGSFTLHPDRDRDSLLHPGEAASGGGQMGSRVRPAAPTSLSPGVQLVLRSDPSPKRGTLRATPSPRTYPFIVRAGCSPDRVTAWVRNQVTGASIQLDLERAAPGPAPVVAATDQVEIAPRWAVGDGSAHPWDFPPAPTPRQEVLGPGRVLVERSRTFASHETVTVAPGTRLELGPEVSLVFLGKVHFEGSEVAPIEVVAKDPHRPFGGLTLHGPGTAGSRLQWVRIEGGARATHGRIVQPATLNLHDTREVTLEHLELIGRAGDQDLLHAGYVQGLQLTDVTLRGAPADAVDLEHTEATLRRIRVVGAGDECLDLMGATVRMFESVLVSCQNNAISAGEESKVDAHHLVVARSRTGVLSKNASAVRLTDSVVQGCKVALRTKKRELYYAGRSSIGASGLHLIGCDKLADAGAGTRLEPGLILRNLPDEPALARLYQAALEQLAEGGAR